MWWPFRHLYFFEGNDALDWRSVWQWHSKEDHNGGAGIVLWPWCGISFGLSLGPYWQLWQAQSQLAEELVRSDFYSGQRDRNRLCSFCYSQRLLEFQVLSGNGVFDGAEVHEASAILVHLSRAGADVSIYAPDVPQMHVLNHAKGEVAEGEIRNVLAESARIARGKISSLADLDAASHDALVFPGGFGVAKNLSSFAVEGADCTVNEEVANSIKDFHAAKKPIGLCCISPVLAAKLIPGVEITVGQDKDDAGRWPYAGTADAVKQMGAKHINKDVHISFYNNFLTVGHIIFYSFLRTLFKFVTNVTIKQESECDSHYSNTKQSALHSFFIFL
ncbi:hypothetical protein OS493_012167 [Desmophyllum pertusum]|uniref:DJ-1/PfpI domain-containing protein n=1 Tax=Desmophyllum pertusum TaxID=174260 RepID=A0A9X0A3R4_9CNID|nr:hypothetical protein OS493_012167 [Desmophyllum pertusum]